jgi:hypothetical protein
MGRRLLALAAAVAARLVVLCAVLLATTSYAHAETTTEPADGGATVERLELWEPAIGWRATTEPSGEAELERLGVRKPLAVNGDIASGDRVITRSARLTLRLHGIGRMVLDPNSSVVIGNRTIMQEIGEALYQVKGIFRVQFHDVSISVEGTRFLVNADNGGAVTVTVARGVVHVTHEAEPDGGVRVHGEEKTRVEPDKPPTTPGPQSVSDVATLTELGERIDHGQWGRWGVPHFQVGALGDAGRFDDAFESGFRAYARLTPGEHWEVSVESGLAFQDTRLHLIEQLGLSRRVGPASLGVAAILAIGPEGATCGSIPPPIARPGAVATARWRWALTRGVAIEPGVAGGWIAPGTSGTSLYLDAALGVTVGR